MKTEVKTETITGQITWIGARKPRIIDFAVDGRVLRLSGFSRVTINAAVGTQVKVTLDRSGYVKEIEVVT